ncbi:MAG: hypothetical protein C0485_05540 [Pirellula sp.]|nr:hypothetical protein [Pirellula sp.]
MLTSLRYALATFCFAASVGCLALWWRSELVVDRVQLVGIGFRKLDCSTFFGSCNISHEKANGFISPVCVVWSQPINRDLRRNMPERAFCVYSQSIQFPIWYPALIFALAGAATLRLGRRFTLRSALIATTVVALLLGMAVIL